MEYRFLCGGPLRKKLHKYHCRSREVDREVRGRGATCRVGGLPAAAAGQDSLGHAPALAAKSVPGCGVLRAPRLAGQCSRTDIRSEVLVRSSLPTDWTIVFFWYD
jgi:hypothetical protein